MKKMILALAILFANLCNINAQNNYYTPWYAMLGFHTNSTTYTSSNEKVKAPLTYIDCRAVLFRPKGYIEFGVPVASYILTGIVTKGGLPNDNGEVSFLYGKLGADLNNGRQFIIGIGASIDARLINVDGIEGYGASLESYGIISPMIYAKINIGKTLLAPVFEYHAVSWANTEGTTRPGYSLGAHLILPIGGRFGLNINPAFEKGRFNSPQSKMSSSNISIKAGIVKNLD
jgi:hypothetical protein